MSLFRVLDMWSTECGADEEFDIGCLTIGNVDNSPEKIDKIVTGSQNGVLRIFKPRISTQEETCQFEFSPDDLLLEAQLKSHILQVGIGVLSSTSALLQLAVLHPFKLSVYSVSGVKGSVEHGLQTKLSLIYEHNLKRHAFSLVIGYFGGIQGKEMLCIQCLDGTLSFFEQERFSFSRFLPKSLLPGPLCYIQKTDSFVTVNGFSVESYRFQNLASATDENSEGENLGFKGKRVTPEWTYKLVDSAIDISMVQDKMSPTIAVLGEKCLTALNSHGQLKFFKKFSFTPKSFFCYREENHGFLISLIATCNETLLVYHETELKWAANLKFLPMCIRRVDGEDLKGLLVLLSEQGSLSCCYLGTDPVLGVPQYAEQKEIDFEEAEKELKTLRKIIKSANQGSLGTQKMGREITLSMSVSPNSTGSETGHHRDTSDKVFGPFYAVKVSLSCRSVVHDVRLTLSADPPLQPSQGVLALGAVAEPSNASAVFHVAMTSAFVPCSLRVTAHAIYVNSYGAPRVVSATTLLPFGSVARTCPPAKEAEIKVTVDINKKLPLLSELFPDLSYDGSSYSGGAMGIEYYSGHTVSIVPSKTSQRYRLQSDHLSALWLCLSELVRRLQHKFRKEVDNNKLKCTCSSSLPLQDYFKVIEEHFTNRQVVSEVEEVLCQRSLQFRVVQKRLLTKLKDSTPSPLNNLDTLLEATHRQIVSVAETLVRHQRALESSCCALSASTQLFLLLLRLSSDRSEDEHAYLSACFSPALPLDSNQGWEERVNVSLVYLLQYCLDKDTSSSHQFPEPHLEPLKDISRLKKHISLVVDKILKNTPIGIGDASFYVEAVHANANEEEEMQSGSQYMETIMQEEDSPNGNNLETDYYLDEMDHAFENPEQEIII